MLMTVHHHTLQLEIFGRWFAALFCCCVVAGALFTPMVNGLPSQVEVNAVAEFFVATRFANATPVTQGSLCTMWTPMIVCSNDTVLKLNFTSANLTGTLPASLSQLKHIIQFDAPNNSITGSFPHQWSSWGGTIIWVNISSNNLTGTLPPELSNWSHVDRLLFAYNQLSGTLPPEYSSMIDLRYFDVSFNKLTGILPASWRTVSKLKGFSVTENSLSGTLPPEFSSWSFISAFVVDNNALTGTLPPEYANWTAIDVFVVNQNFLSGTLPVEYSEAWTQMSTLRLRSNSFGGTLPAEYSRLPISVFDASSNQLSGTLPPQYAAWSSAQSLAFPNNMLTGTIPASWGMSMSQLKSLLLYNNSLSGTIPSSPSFLSLSVYSISFNDFAGTLPSSSSWPQLLILDAQNNTQLTGHIALQQLVSIASTCGTELCSDAAFTGTCVCVTGDALANAIAVASVTPLLLFELATYAVPPRSCTATTSVVPVPTGTFPTGKINATNEASLPTASINTVSGVAAAAALGAALAAVDAADAQMLVSILGSPCVCSATSPAQQQEDGSVLLLALSPFSPLGSAWTAIGNSLLCCVLVGLHATAVFILTAKCSHVTQQSRSSKCPPLNTLLGRWLRKDKTNDSRCRRKFLSQLRFPNVSVTLLMFLVPGVVRACMMTTNSFVTSRNNRDDGGDSPILSTVAIAVGVVFVVCACGFVEFVAYRHAHVEVITGYARYNGVNNFPTEASEQFLLSFVRHQHPMRLFKPIPRRVALMALPRGAWEPRAARTAYGGVISSYLAPWRRAWAVVPGANIIVQLLNGVGGDDTTCDALQSITLIALVGVCAFIAHARPHRALLASYLVCASLVLTMVTALLGLLCRHGVVSSDAVSGFGMFASVAMFVFKLYHVLMPIVERRLMARNVGLVASPSWPMQPVVSAEAADFNEVSDPRRRRNGNATAAVEEAKVLPLSNEQIEAHRKRLSIEQMKALRELILMVVERSSDGGAQLLL